MATFQDNNATIHQAQIFHTWISTTESRP